MDAEDESKGGAGATEANGGTEGEQTTAAAAEGSDGGEGLTDEHGHPAISKGKYERDIAAKDAKIADLEAKVNDSSRTEEGRNALAEEIEKLKADIAEERIAHKLDVAGCRNAKAARALLDDHGGDVEKLKEAEPWLFAKDKKEGSTGLKPEGAPKGGAAKTIRDALKQI